VADVTTSTTLASTSRRHVVILTNVLDGTAEEAAVQKVDISGLPGSPTKVAIARAAWCCDGVKVKVGFDHTADDYVMICAGQHSMDMRDYGGVADPASTGETGDVIFTTVGATADDTYSILLELEY
tara:strand:- start:3430 stop:3807 length:378 start_codon:yes stop_codon:yes gene_type:complete